jgi:hypothetical protein
MATRCWYYDGLPWEVKWCMWCMWCMWWLKQDTYCRRKQGDPDASPIFWMSLPDSRQQSESIDFWAISESESNVVLSSLSRTHTKCFESHFFFLSFVMSKLKKANLILLYATSVNRARVCDCQRWDTVHRYVEKTKQLQSVNIPLSSETIQINSNHGSLLPNYVWRRMTLMDDENNDYWRNSNNSFHIAKHHGYFILFDQKLSAIFGRSFFFTNVWDVLSR